MPRVQVTKAELTKAVLNKLLADHYPEATEKQRAAELAARFDEASGKVRRSKSPDTYKTETVYQSELERAHNRFTFLSSKAVAAQPAPVVEEAEQVEEDQEPSDVGAIEV